MANHECRICGETHRSLEALEDHHDVEHPSKEFRGPASSSTAFQAQTRRLLERTPYRFVAGLVVGIAITTAAFSAPTWMSNNSKLDFTVVTCENCSYERFETATGRIFDSRFSEVSVDSSRGQRLVEKYELNYVPGFIVEKSVENHENFSQISSAVVEFEDAYVLSDRGNEAAQRFSEGRALEQ